MDPPTYVHVIPVSAVDVPALSGVVSVLKYCVWDRGTYLHAVVKDIMFIWLLFRDQRISVVVVLYNHCLPTVHL